MAVRSDKNNIPYTFSSEIQACIHDTEKNMELIYTSQYKQFKPYCEKLLMHAIEEQSDYLFALAYYYYAQYFATDNDYINTISSALEGIKYQQKVQLNELIARSYNILGVYTQSAGDVTKSVEYLLTGVDFCNLHHLDYAHCMLAGNLADIFHRTSNFDRALHYYDESEYYYNKCYSDSNISSYNTIICLYCNKCYCLLSINRIDEVKEFTEKLSQIIKSARESNQIIPEFVVNTYYATYYHNIGNSEKRDFYLELAKKYFHSLNSYIHLMEDIKAYLKLYKELGYFDELISILESYILKCEQDQAPFHISSFFLSERLACARQLNDMDTYLLYAQKFFDAFQNDQTKNSDATLRAEETHREYNRIQKQQYEMHLLNEKLLVQSQHDTLTALPNRSYLNSYAEETLAAACKNQVAFGIEILDIDHFKHINDTYGHMAGDKYLTSLADQLQHITEEFSDVFAARYGGDEFVIVYYNKSIDEINEIMARLKKHVSTIKLPEIGPVGVDSLSLSQGCCNMIPNPANRIWDFLSTADITLYDVKMNGRNGFLVRDSFHNAI